MSKTKSAFFCNNCGYESTKWVGKCPACNEWNTFTEELIDSGKKKKQAGMDIVINKKDLN
jgi:DNA repair protein RadA/Sms